MKAPAAGKVARATDADRAELRAGLVRLLRESSPESAVRAVIDTDPGYDEKLWHRLVHDVGLLALPIAEEVGGAGYGWSEAAVGLEQTGAALCPSPLLSSSFATIALSQLASESARDALLPAIADGSQLVTFATGCLLDSERRPTTSIPCGNAGHISLAGSLGTVLDAQVADKIVFLGRRPDGRSMLLLVEKGTVHASVRPLLGMDLTRRMSSVEFAGARAEAIGRGYVEDAELARVHALCSLMLAAEQLGGATAAFETTLQYLRSRVQFGRPIGSFQALKHRCADIAVELESARATLDAALREVDSDSPDLELYAHLAAASCSDVYLLTARAMVQLHGGIGFTWEHSAHLHLKRAKTGQLLLGLPATHRRLAVERAGLDLCGGRR